mmetsp:Transcript_28152/g.38920  ORF Transcript_28152/g.38920 Transcript_28152/m.38920 type:complete len:235 (+) Transcript_28152:110-814(+)
MIGPPSSLEIIASLAVFALVSYALYVDICKVPLLGELKGTPLGKLSFLTVWINIIWVVFRGLGAVEVCLRWAWGHPVETITQVAFAGEAFIGGSGFFLTLAYYSLVHFDDSLWKWYAKCVKDGSIPYSVETHVFYQHLVHLPHLFLAVFTAYFRHPKLLLQHMPEQIQVILICIVFGIFYICCVMSSYKASGYWPYPFYNKFMNWYDHAMFYTICFGLFTCLAILDRWCILRLH